MTRAERQAQRKRLDEVKRQSAAIVVAGKCPDCGAGLRQNLALSGWWQCEQFGAEGFRKDAKRPSCNFQCFTE